MVSRPLNTVDRLDRPSAYYHNRNKRKRHDRRDDRDGDAEMRDGATEDKEPEDPLANSTTLYVGNL